MQLFSKKSDNYLLVKLLNAGKLNVIPGISKQQAGVKKILCIVAALAGWSGCATPTLMDEPSVTLAETPKNIVLMIGDGMGLSQISAAMYSNNNRLALEQFPVIGFHKSYSSDNLVTDSAAGATAFSCGVKSYNNAIGMTVDTARCQTILEEAEKRKLATGMVATATIVHATPASFMAHQPYRENYEAIALDYMDTDVDLLIGGGKKFFDRRNMDNRNLIAEMRHRGYWIYDYSQSELSQARAKPGANLVYFTADNHPLSVANGRTYLPEASTIAVNFLKQKNENGFFLMIEGSQIDWMGHANEGRLLISELLDFNQAIAAVLAFAKKDGNTLVIVTGDHESGGMAINEDSKMNAVRPKFTTNGHTGTLVPVYAYGPKAALFSGIYENTAIYHKMREALGWEGAAAPQ